MALPAFPNARRIGVKTPAVSVVVLQPRSTRNSSTSNLQIRCRPHANDRWAQPSEAHVIGLIEREGVGSRDIRHKVASDECAAGHDVVRSVAVHRGRSPWVGHSEVDVVDHARLRGLIGSRGDRDGTAGWLQEVACGVGDDDAGRRGDAELQHGVSSSVGH
jgi:hypothetical protein